MATSNLPRTWCGVHQEDWWLEITPPYVLTPADIARSAASDARLANPTVWTPLPEDSTRYDAASALHWSAVQARRRRAWEADATPDTRYLDAASEIAANGESA